MRGRLVSTLPLNEPVLEHIRWPQGFLATSRRRPLYICPDRLVSHLAGIIAVLNDLYGCCLA